MQRWSVGAVALAVACSGTDTRSTGPGAEVGLLQRVPQSSAPAPSASWLPSEGGWLSGAGVPNARVAVATEGNRFRLSDPTSGLSAEVLLEEVGSRSARLLRPDTLVAGAPASPTSVFRLRSDGLEDFMFAPASSEVSYRLRLSGAVRGLRLVDGTLELVDAGGAPRLRVFAAWVEDAAGVRHRASLTLDGCAADRDPSAPWGRSPVHPGARECRVVIGWPTAVRASLVDPAWTTTGSMKAGRLAHAAVLLDTGKVLVVGGSGTFANGTVTELWDPTTETWATTGSTALPGEAARTQVAKLTNGRVLLVESSSAELYDPVAGTWSTTSPPGETRSGHTVTALPNGKALVAGGSGAGGALDSAELFDPATNAFSPTGKLSAPRTGHRAVLLVSGKVMLMGATLFTGSPYKKTDLYDPSTGSFTAGSEMVHGREKHAAALLDDGRVLVAGGCECSGSNIPAESYDPATDTWSSVGPVPGQDDIDNLALAPLPGGRALATGGWNFGVKDFASVFGTGWAPASPMNTGRSGHTATALPDGSVLVAGGQTSQAAALSSSERFRVTQKGQACTTGGDCETGYCVDGLCCDSACPGPCQACTTAKGASSDGTCTPLPPQTSCAASSCSTSTFFPGSACDGAGTCVTGTEQSCAPFVCDAQGCKTSCAVDADCLNGMACVSGSCKAKDGYSCSADPECAGGHCDQGICCASPPCSGVDGGPQPSCKTDSDCPTGWACAIGKCYPPSPGSDAGMSGGGSSDGGCGCRLARRHSRGDLLVALLMALVVAGARRRRRSVRPPES